MKLVFMGDTHIGKRFPYTTAASAEVFKDMRRYAMGLFDAHLDVSIIQLGDLFDSFRVGMYDLIEGYTFASLTNVSTLAGNHDKSNDTSKASALQLLRTEMGCKVVWSEPEYRAMAGTQVVMVPHQLTQAGFEQELDRAVKVANEKPELLNILCLHCNYGEPHGKDTENYLRPAKAKELLETFTYVISGHEHDSSQPLPGLIMAGSVLPFSFGEMTSKYIWVYDTDTKAMTQECTWSADQFKRASVQEALKIGDLTMTSIDFLEITGQATVEEATLLNKRIAEWYTKTKVVAIKPAFSLIRHDKEVQTEKTEHWFDAILKQCNAEQQKILTATRGSLK